AIYHVIGQILVAMIFLSTPLIVYYLPIIAISAVITGVLVGITAKLIIKTGVIRKQREKYNF
ncbi:MAG: Gx transporter family protein, partial [Bacilli bacterium]|nr:Gx transporter family protein [Bacilli bacterium]